MTGEANIMRLWTKAPVASLSILFHKPLYICSFLIASGVEGIQCDLAMPLNLFSYLESMNEYIVCLAFCPC